MSLEIIGEKRFELRQRSSQFRRLCSSSWCANFQCILWHSFEQYDTDLHLLQVCNACWKHTGQFVKGIPDVVSVLSPCRSKNMESTLIHPPISSWASIGCIDLYCSSKAIGLNILEISFSFIKNFSKKCLRTKHIGFIDASHFAQLSFLFSLSC